MIRAALAPGQARAGAGLAAVAGVVLLAGCSSAPESGADDNADPAPAAPTGTAAPTGSAGSAGSGSYADGTYSAEGVYATPETVESLTVTVTLEDDVITELEVTGDPQRRETEQYQGQFIGGIAEVVVGRDIDEIEVSRVAGSSLTSGGFNEAIEAIKAEAAA